MTCRRRDRSEPVAIRGRGLVRGRRASDQRAAGAVDRHAVRLVGGGAPDVRDVLEGRAARIQPGDERVLVAVGGGVCAWNRSDPSPSGNVASFEVFPGDIGSVRTVDGDAYNARLSLVPTNVAGIVDVRIDHQGQARVVAPSLNPTSTSDASGGPST